MKTLVGHNENLFYSLEDGKRLVIAFTSFSDRLDKMNFEFAHALKDVDASKIFIRNRQKVWYHSGISEELNNISKLKEFLAELIKRVSPPHITCVGASAGGYASILFGHFLKADIVHAFGPQTFLDRSQNEFHGIFGHLPGEEGEGIEFWCKEMCNLYNLDITQEECYYDLKDFITPWNRITNYYIHVSDFPEENEGALADNIYAEHLSECDGVSIVKYPCPGHGCAGSYLRDRGKLASVILDKGD